MTHPLLRTPLDPVHRAASALMGEVDGWGKPLHYGDPAAEHRAARTGAAMIDRSQAGRLRLTGARRLDLLHRLSTQDLRGLGPGQGARAALLTDKGRLIDLLHVHVSEDHVLVVTSPGQGPAVQRHIESLRFRDDVQLAEVTGGTAMLELIGPRAAQLLGEASGESGLGALARHHARALTVAGRPVFAARTAGMGGGFRLITAAEGAAAVWGALAGSAGGARAVPMGEQAFEVLRVERGVPRHGRELTLEHNPLEARLDDTISWTKGCYIGQEVVARLDSRQKVSRLLCGLLLDPAAGQLPDPGQLLEAPGAPMEAGRITSAVDSLALGRPIALAYVRQEHASPGTSVVLAGSGERRSATVTELPFGAGSMASA